jgi:predicted DNA-binding transcriptional regulator YafY
MRADRLLSILLLLQRGRRLTARELAKRLEVSERTILRDMDALSGAGVPVVAGRGKSGGWSLLGDYQTKLTGLNAAEVQALVLAHPERLLADLGLHRAGAAALLKIEAALPESAREHAEFARRCIIIDPRGWRDPSESITCLPLLLDAVWRGRQIRFVYVRTLAEPAERTADPLGLVAKGSTWYLVAQAHGEVRTYRVSRIREITILDTPAEHPPDFDLGKYWDRATTEFREQLPRYYATFLVNPSVMRWIRYRGWRLEQETPEGDRVRIRLRFDIEEEAVQFALSFGADLAVSEPLALQQKVFAAARAILARSEPDKTRGISGNSDISRLD